MVWTWYVVFVLNTFCLFEFCVKIIFFYRDNLFLYTLRNKKNLVDAVTPTLDKVHMQVGSSVTQVV